MKQYLDLMRHILDNGVVKSDRTGTGTKSVFGPQISFDLSKGFPLVTTKRLHIKSIIHELLWIISGSTNNNDLEARGVNIWKEWARKDGSLGPIYGQQFRAWGSFGTRVSGIDQIARLIERLKSNPDCRRHIVSAWNVSDLPYMVLSPCHAFFQCYVADGKLSLKLYQRSADMLLGTPFNIASYALLTHMLADVCGLQVGEFVHTFGDAHLYLNHLEQAELQLSREPRELPTLQLNHRDCIDDYVFEDVTILNYDPHPAIKAEVSV